MRWLMSIIVWVGIIGAQVGLAQEAPTEFEVASVKKLAQPSNIHMGRGGPGTADPEHLTIRNNTLQALLVSAYGLRPLQISGPGWLETDYYDLLANVPAGITRKQMAVMLQNLLIKRFQLVVHHETRTFQVYELTVGKGGAKLNASPSENQHGPRQESRTANNHAEVTFSEYSMDAFAGWLGSQLAVPVFNATGLAGAYDMTFEFGKETPGQSDPGSPFLAPIQTVLEQRFGLRLQSAKRQLDVLVVDHANKMPTEN
jgi:uncharacterized protein (TIGR03435 family)